MLTYSIKTWINIVCVEVIKYNGKKWINKKESETTLGCKNLAGNKTRYYSNEFRKRSDEIQDRKIFNLVENLLQKN